MHSQSREFGEGKDVHPSASLAIISVQACMTVEQHVNQHAQMQGVPVFLGLPTCTVQCSAVAGHMPWYEPDQGVVFYDSLSRAGLPRGLRDPRLQCRLHQGVLKKVF